MKMIAICIILALSPVNALWYFVVLRKDIPLYIDLKLKYRAPSSIYHLNVRKIIENGE